VCVCACVDVCMHAYAFAAQYTASGFDALAFVDDRSRVSAFAPSCVLRVPVCVCVCVCVYACVEKYAHTFMLHYNLLSYKSTKKKLSSHTMRRNALYTRVYKHYIYIYIYVYICICMYVYACICTYTLQTHYPAGRKQVHGLIIIKYLPNIYMYIYIYVCVCIYISRVSSPLSLSLSLSLPCRRCGVCWTFVDRRMSRASEVVPREFSPGVCTHFSACARLPRRALRGRSNPQLRVVGSIPLRAIESR